VYIALTKKGGTQIKIQTSVKPSELVFMAFDVPYLVAASMKSMMAVAIERISTVKATKSKLCC